MSPMTTSTPICLLGLRERVITDLEALDIFTCGTLMRRLTKLEYTCGFGAVAMREIREALWIASEDGVPDEAQPEEGDPTLEEVWSRAAEIRAERCGVSA